jgi:hypothetical protein
MVMAEVLRDEHGGVLDPLAAVAGKINALLDKAAKADEKAETYRISAGQELARARERVEAGEAGTTTWTAWCADNIKRSEGDIRKLLAIASSADPTKAAAAERQRNREAVARHRAYVSAVSGQCAVRAKNSVAAVAEPMPVTIDTVKRDIQLLSADERSVLADWLIEIVSADERGTEAERSPAMASAAVTTASEETAEPPLVDDGPAASIAADPPPQSTAPSPEPTPEAAKPPERMADPGEEALEPASARGNDQPPPKANPAIEVAAAPADLPSVIPHQTACSEAAIPWKTPAEALEGLL